MINSLSENQQHTKKVSELFKGLYNLSYTGKFTLKKKSNNISKNDVYYLMTKILLGPNIDKVLYKAQELGILNNIIIGIDNVIQLKDSKNKFKDLWPHTVQVVKQSKPTIEIRNAALFHDFGKPATIKFENNKVTFYNHESVSVKYFVNFANQWRIYTPKQFNKIKFLIKNLGYIESYNLNWTDSAVRRFYKKVGENLDDLIELSRADVTSYNPEQHKRVNANLDSLKNRIFLLKEQDNKKAFLPKGFGHALIDIGYGKEIGKIKSFIEEEIKNNKLKPYENIEYYLNYIKK